MMYQFTRDLLLRLQTNLALRGHQATPEVEDYVVDNLNDFIGFSVQRETFVHTFAAHKLGIEAGDVRASLIHFILMGWFDQTGIDGNTIIFTPTKGMWNNRPTRKGQENAKVSSQL